MIDELRSDGYEGVRLDGYDKDGRFVSHVFVRMFDVGKALASFKSLQKTMTDMFMQQMSMFSETLKTQTELLKQIAELKKSLTEEKPTYVDAIAQIMYLKELEKTLMESLGITPNQIHTNPQLQAFLVEIAKDLMKKYLPEIEKKFKEKFGEEVKTLSVAPSPLPMPSVMPSPPPQIEIPKNIEERLNQIAESVEKQIQPPCMKGEEKCLET